MQDTHLKLKHFHKKICATCKEPIYKLTFDDYGWAFDGLTFCSYKCMREYEKTHEKKLKMKWS